MTFLSDLKQVINDRTVAIVCMGQSLEDFEKHATELAKLDLCWVTIGRYWLVEPLLKKHGIKLEVVLDYSAGLRDFKDRFEAFDGLCFHREPYNFSKGKNTLYAFLMVCIQNDIRDVVLFGADGYHDTGFAYYDKFEGKVEKYYEGQREQHEKEVREFNEYFPKERENTIITNVSPNSKYTVFERVKYDVYIANSTDKRKS